MVAVKLWDTEAAAEAVKPLLRPGTAVVSFQNGVDKDAVLTRILGRDAVVGGVGQIGVVIASPGVISTHRHHGEAPLRRAGQHSIGACRGIAGGLQGLRGSTPRYPTISTWRSGRSSSSWSDVGLHGEHALHARPDPRHAQARAFLQDVIREAVAVGRALGVALADDFAEQRMASSRHCRHR